MAACSGWVAVLLTTLVVLLTTFATLVPLSLAFNRYNVGGRQNWTPNVNYTEWVKNKTFYVGDWLVFLYEKGRGDVVQVNKTNYEKCEAKDPIRNWSRGRSYAFRLNHTGDYYFICSYGYCYQGMKVHIHAQKVPPPSPLPKSLHSLSAPLLSRPAASALRVVLAAALCWCFL